MLEGRTRGREEVGKGQETNERSFQLCIQVLNGIWKDERVGEEPTPNHSERSGKEMSHSGCGNSISASHEGQSMIPYKCGYLFVLGQWKARQKQVSRICPIKIQGQGTSLEIWCALWISNSSHHVFCQWNVDVATA